MALRRVVRRGRALPMPVETWRGRLTAFAAAGVVTLGAAGFVAVGPAAAGPQALAAFGDCPSFTAHMRALAADAAERATHRGAGPTASARASGGQTPGAQTPGGGVA